MNKDKCRLNDQQIFETDCSFDAIVRELRLRRVVGALQYQQWQCRLVGFANYQEIQFTEMVPVAAPGVGGGGRVFGRPAQLPSVLACDNTRLWWDNVKTAERSGYTRIQHDHGQENALNGGGE